jgi:hypothetical protein
VLLALGVAVLLLVERRVRGLLRKGPQPLGFDRRRNR